MAHVEADANRNDSSEALGGGPDEESAFRQVNQMVNEQTLNPSSQNPDRVIRTHLKGTLKNDSSRAQQRLSPSSRGTAGLSKITFGEE